MSATFENVFRVSGLHKLCDGLQPVQDLGLHARLAHRDQHQEGRRWAQVAGLAAARRVLESHLVLGEEAGEHQLLLLWCHLGKVDSLHAQFRLYYFRFQK